MTFSGSNGLAVAVPENFTYASNEAQASVKRAKMPYRPVLSASEQARLLKAVIEWKRETRHLSLRRDKMENPNFSSIVSFGSAAIPAIISDLKREPGYLFLALAEITGENPVLEGFRGDLPAMVEAWVRWFQSELGQER